MDFQRNIGLSAIAVMFLFGASETFAQSTLDHPVGEYVAMDYLTDNFINQTNQEEVVYSDLISFDQAGWVRLYFKDVAIDPGSFLRMTSVEDNEQQILDDRGLSNWSNTSAYFNGDAVLIELVAGPHTINNQFGIDRVAVQFAEAGVDQSCGICGPDDRVPSSMNHHGRLMPVGCSATVYNTDSCIVSAGHCMDSGLVIEFNVPPSRTNCTVVHPPVADQFPLGTLRYVNGGVGNDWAVATTGANSLGQTAYERYGLIRPIAQSPANIGDTGDVWGYGIDDECTRTQVQQYSTGTFVSRFFNYYDFMIDITFGNSGSGLVHNGEVVGIVTHCRDGCPNIATRTDLAAFADARNQLCPDQPPTCLTLELDQFVAGDSTRFTVRDGDAGQKAAVLWSQKAGSFKYQGMGYCVDFGIDLPSNPLTRIVGQGKFNSAGVYAVIRSIPSNVKGQQFFFQATMGGTCPDTCMSNVWLGVAQ